jgi:hypothetical protein
MVRAPASWRITPLRQPNRNNLIKTFLQEKSSGDQQAKRRKEEKT